MSTHQASRFVGRERELHALRTEFDSTLRGETRSAFLIGEAGIGKTSTARAFVDEAREQGALVAWARGHEGFGVPVYRPWAQVFRSIAAEAERAIHDPLEAVRDALQRDTPLGVGEAAPERARFALFDQVCEALSLAAAARPLVITLDDLHAVDVASLRLLDFVVRELVSARLLIVGALRDPGPSPADERVALLPAVIERGRSVPLRGLSSEAVRLVLIDRIGGAHAESGEAAPQPDEQMVAQVLGATGGNPFLVIEVAWVSDGTVTGTFQLADINVGAGNGVSFIPSYTGVGGLVYFGADDGTGYSLWALQSVAPSVPVLMNPGLVVLALALLVIARRRLTRTA